MQLAYLGQMLLNAVIKKKKKKRARIFTILVKSKCRQAREYSTP